MQVRDAVALVSNRAHLEPPPALPPRLFVNMDSKAFVALCAADARLPAIIRAAAAELRDASGGGEEASKVVALADYVRAHRDIAGSTLQQAAKEAAKGADWRGVGWVQIVIAVALHNTAAKILARRPR
jgi:hypothetical protein